MTIDDLVVLYEEHRNCMKVNPRAHAMRVVVRALRDAAARSEYPLRMLNEILGEAGEKVAGTDTAKPEAIERSTPAAALRAAAGGGE